MCPRSKPTTNRVVHWRSAVHQKNKYYQLSQSHAHQHQADIEMQDPPDVPGTQNHSYSDHQDHMDASWGSTDGQLSLGINQHVNSKTLEEELDEAERLELLRITSPEDEWEDVEDDLPDDQPASAIEERPIVRTDKRSNRVNNSVWYPFKSLAVSCSLYIFHTLYIWADYLCTSVQDIQASIIIGYTHSMLSRTLYEKTRAVMSISNSNLPAWATV